jgi:hypothetical protein
MFKPKSYFNRMFLLLIAVTLATVAVANTSNKWRLQFSGNSESAGEIVIQIAPEDGQPFSVTISFEEGLSENKVAKRVVTVLESKLPEDVYKVERDDGEDVLIKKRFGEEDFEVSITSNTVKNTRINLDRE